MDKLTFLNTLRAELAAWETLLSNVDHRRWRQRSLAGGRALQDVVAHINAYQIGLVEWLAAARQGVALRLPDLDDPDLEHRNERILQKNRARSWQDVLFEALQTHRRLIAVTGEFSEEELTDPELSAAFVIPRWGKPLPLWQCIANDSYEHIHQHAEEVRAWLAAPLD